MTNSPSNARFSWQKSRWTGSASVSGGTQGATGYSPTKANFCTRVQLMYNICSKILRNSFLLGKEKSQHVSGPVSANIYVSFATKFICIICLTYITALHRCIFSLLIILCLLMCKSAGYVRLTAQQQQQLMRQKSLSASSNSVQSPPGV